MNNIANFHNIASLDTLVGATNTLSSVVLVTNNMIHSFLFYNDLESYI